MSRCANGVSAARTAGCVPFRIFRPLPQKFREIRLQDGVQLLSPSRLALRKGKPENGQFGRIHLAQFEHLRKMRGQPLVVEGRRRRQGFRLVQNDHAVDFPFPAPQDGVKIRLPAIQIAVHRVDPKGEIRHVGRAQPRETHRIELNGQNPIGPDPQFDMGGKVPDAHQGVDLPEKRLKTRLVRFDNVLTRIIQPIAYVAQRRETVFEDIQDDRFALSVEIHVHGELFPGNVFLHQERRLVDHQM